MKQIRYIDESNKTQLVPTMELLGYRTKNTVYAVEDIAYHANLPTGWYLKCTGAGTTSNSDLTIDSPVLENTVSDGTVTWTIKNTDINNTTLVTVSSFDSNTGILELTSLS